MSICIKFNPHDIWIGIYWRRSTSLWRQITDIYVCVLPMLPIHISWSKHQ
jgi:hypothetical protein